MENKCGLALNYFLENKDLLAHATEFFVDAKRKSAAKQIHMETGGTPIDLNANAAAQIIPLHGEDS